MPVARNEKQRLEIDLEQRVFSLTRLKISDRETGKPCHAAGVLMANTATMDRSLARGSLHRVVRPFKAYME